MEKRMQKVSGYMDQFTTHPYAGSRVGNVLNDAVKNRGKMIRPSLLLLSGKFGEKFYEKEEQLCKLAAAVELTHMASLIHDDIVDDAPFRRRCPSVQSRYGKNEAVYAGDFLMSRVSFHLLQADLNQAGAVLLHAVEQMCTGEIGQSLCKYCENVTKEQYLNNIHGKTAALFIAACHIGTMEAGCQRDVIQQMDSFGEHLGLLFQIRDDLMDYLSSEEQEGKKTHKDFLDGIYTMPLLLAMEDPEGKQALLPYLKANAAGTITENEISNMEKKILLFGGIERTKYVFNQHRKDAEEILNSLKAKNREAVDGLFSVLEKLGV